MHMRVATRSSSGLTTPSDPQKKNVGPEAEGSDHCVSTVNSSHNRLSSNTTINNRVRGQRLFLPSERNRVSCRSLLNLTRGAVGVCGSFLMRFVLF